MKRRHLQLESLEPRELLSVSAGDFNAIRSQYVDLNLSVNQSDYNIIEITAAQLSDTNFRNAIAEAVTTTENDLIVLRTTANDNTITLNGSSLNISGADGSINIVSLGTDKLTIDANSGSSCLYVNDDNSGVVTVGGLIFTNGVAELHSGVYYGGAIYNDGFLVLDDCIITENSSALYGGGIGNAGTMIVYDSTISNNTAQGQLGDEAAGGIGNDGEMDLYDCVITGNASDFRGGGIGNGSTGYLYIAGGEITGNYAYGNDVICSAGVFNAGYLETGFRYYYDENWEVLFDDREESKHALVVSDNVATNSNTAGGIGTFNGSAYLLNTIVTNNTGSGIGTFNGGSAYLLNTIVTNNTDSGILARDADDIYVTNCIVAGNDSTGISAIYSNSVNIYNSTFINGGYVAGNLTVYNSILMEYIGSSGTPTAYNNLVFTDGAYLISHGNIDYDANKPLFVDAANGDYRLAANSQAIDKGSNTYTSEIITDLAGNLRIANGTVDLGAYEYGSVPPETPSTIVTTENDIVDVSDGLISLREAIDYAANGATITFAANMQGKTIKLSYGESLWDSRLEFYKDITIDGSGRDITIDANGATYCIYNNFGVTTTFIGLTIAGETDDSFMINYGTLILTNTVVAGEDEVLGINISTGRIVLNNSTVVVTAKDGSLWIEGSLEVNNSIIIGNYFYMMGSYASVNVRNSLLSGIVLGDDYWPMHSIINGVSGFTIDQSSIVGDSIDPGFVRFSQNEGWNNDTGNNINNIWTTYDLRLTANSPAINKGNNSLVPAGITTDRAGNARIYGTTVDIGAYEYDPTIAVLDPPANLRVTQQGKTSLTLSWNKVEGATGYVLQRKGSDGNFVPIKTVTTLQYVDSELTAGTTYSYRICAVNASGSSLFSGEINAATLNNITDPDDPDYVADVPAVMEATLDSETKKASLEWVTLGSDYTYYVFRNGALVSKGQTGNTYVDNNPPTTTKYLIIAYNQWTGDWTRSLPVVLSTAPVKSAIVSHELTAQGGIKLNWNIQESQQFIVFRNGIPVSGTISSKTWTDTEPLPIAAGNQYILYVNYSDENGSSYWTWSSPYVVQKPTAQAAASPLDAFWAEYDGVTIDDDVLNAIV